MKRLSLALLALVAAHAAATIGCMDREPAPVCPVPTELNSTEAMIGGFEGVDMLVVVDNSSSMTEEQEILATSFFPLINSLVSPLPGWDFPAVDDVRVAIVTSDMGLSWGGHEYQDGDGWPYTNSWGGAGDNGRFQTDIASMVSIEEGVIECGESAAQCPTGWVCENIGDDGRGVCNDPDGDGTNQTCPGMSSTWFETTPGNANLDLAFQVSCLSKQGTGGCGFEQQLQSAARALTRDDQEAFIRKESLLAILVVSDEEDCSMEDGPGLFATDDIQGTDGPSRLNVACGNNPQYLYDAKHYFDTYTSVKESSNAVIFAAIVGVPKGDACEGTGDMIGGCLDQDEMQLEEVLEQDPNGNDAYYFRAACTRDEGVEEVTKAYPGIRYVELATEQFQRMSYVYSICNKDWSPAMNEISQLIASSIQGTCYEKPLDWDPATKTAKCDVVVEFTGAEECPASFDDDDPEVIEDENEDVETTNILCTLPKLEAPRDCADVDADALNGRFGWYYCENTTTEDFADACSDGIDNDGDGDVDCDDSECQACTICPGGTDACSGKCRYMVQVTDAAKEEVQRNSISVQCIQQFSFEDPNCQEDTAAACDDGLDNDGNGVADCEDDFEAKTPYAADANCCPMTKGSGGACVIDDAAKDICDFPSGGYPAACVAHASLLSCTLP